MPNAANKNKETATDPKNLTIMEEFKALNITFENLITKFMLCRLKFWDGLLIFLKVIKICIFIHYFITKFQFLHFSTNVRISRHIVFVQFRLQKSLILKSRNRTQKRERL